MKRFFSYDNDSDGFQDHENSESAKTRTQENLRDAIEHMDVCDEPGLICWGEIREQVQQYGNGEDGTVGYQLRPLPIPDDQPAWRDRPMVSGDYRAIYPDDEDYVDTILSIDDEDIIAGRFENFGRFYGPLPPDPKAKGSA